MICGSPSFTPSLIAVIAQSFCSLASALFVGLVVTMSCHLHVLGIGMQHQRAVR